MNEGKKIIDNAKAEILKEEYIRKLVDQARKDKKNIVIELFEGCFEGVHNLPEGFTYTLIDWDYLKEQDIQECKDFMEELQRK